MTENRSGSWKSPGRQRSLRSKLVQDKTYIAPVFSVARIMGLDSDQAARFLILLLVLVLWNRYL
jgi:hypothetical protein